jgi:hypothetical protein
VDLLLAIRYSFWQREPLGLFAYFQCIFGLTALRGTFTIDHYPVQSTPMKSIIRSLLFVSLVASAQASSITQANNRTYLASLGLSGLVEWGTPVDEGTGLASGSVRTSSPGGVDVTITGTGMDIAVEGSAASGNFALNEVLLFSNQAITLTFSTAIQGFGFQIQRLELGNFDANVEAFDAGAVSLGSVSASGVSTFGPGTETAPFLGFFSTVNNIVSVVISVTPPPAGSTDFAINSGTVLTNLDSVPEPQTISMIGLGVAALALLRRRR